MKDGEQLNSLVDALAVKSVELQTQARVIEGFFKSYFERMQQVLHIEHLLNGLIPLVEAIHTAQPAQLLESSRKDYPDHNILLTKALVYLIETYGLTQDLHVNGAALAILRDPRILKLAHKNNHQLIFEINRVIKRRKEAQEIEAEKQRIRLFLTQQLKTVDKLERYTQAISRFLYFVEHPIEEAEMKMALKDLLDDTKGDPDMIVLMTYMVHGRSHWNLLNTIYQYYREENPLGVEDLIRRLRMRQEGYRDKKGDKYRGRIDAIDQLIDDLMLVDHVHVYTAQKTEDQARWMAVGGFAFGMEIAMLALENIALTTSLSPWAILGISLGACLVFGPMIAIYFHTGHYNELKKMNQREYFEQLRPSPSTDKLGWGKIVGHVGTFEEGAAAGTLLLTLGSLVFLDTISRGIIGGDYNSALPGFYFVTEVLMNCHWGWYFPAGLAIAGLLYASFQTACSMKAAHFALDVPNSIEYFDDLEKDAQMRGVINPQTREPLYFSKSLKWRHEIDNAIAEFKEEYFPTERQHSPDI